MQCLDHKILLVSNVMFMCRSGLLRTLKELFCEFKKQFPDKKIGFSKFCALRPKQCILAGSPGAHSICVCSIPENEKLMLSAVKLQKSYHELIDMIGCSRESKQCMVHRCPSCPDGSELTSYLKQHLEQHACKNLRDDDHDDSDDGLKAGDFARYCRKL